jgi:FkbM family methyltransferase
MKELANLTKRILNFRKKSRQKKFESYASRLIRWFPGVPFPVRLPSGFWWLMDTDFIGQSLLDGGYETVESDFAANFLKPGMTVLDVGAHRGFHTLLFSRKVGKHGHVLSFEPSPPDGKRLRLHLKLNQCRNVEVIQCALGEEDGAANLYAVPANSVLNSLRPPSTGFPTCTIPVPVRKLDGVLSHAPFQRVDFMKLDVEGGELGVLKGAEQLLSTVPRPVILCEVLQKATGAWGYSSRLIVEYLSERGFVWFVLNEKAELVPTGDESREFQGNFIAVPAESLPRIAHLRAPAHGNSHVAGG